MSPEIQQILQHTLDAIEASIRGEIQPQELADDAGFSLSHFYHVFEAACGMSLGRYVTHRRLTHAAWALSRGMDATSAALEYGFDTHAGFYKAFRREYGCSPSAYLKGYHPLPPARVNLKEEIKMTDPRKLSQVLSHWNLEDATITPVHYANTGNRSENTFAIGNDYYLKQSAALGHMHRQVKLLEALAACSLAPQIVPAQDGRKFISLDGIDYMLTRRVEGKSLSAADLMANPSKARAVGNGLARLHTALRSCDPVLCTAENYTATICSWAVPTARNILSIDQQWLETFCQRVQMNFPSLPTQIIHRDPNPDNLLIHNGQVTGFLDFDLGRIMPRLFDLCYAATGILSVTWNRCDAPMEHFFTLFKELTDGYCDVSPLTDVERNAVPDMVLSIQLMCVAAFFGSDKLSYQFQVNCDMFRFLWEHRDAL